MVVLPDSPVPKGHVQCASCLHWMPDPKQRRYTCPHCGTQPVPSTAYPEGSAFHPVRLRRRKTLRQRLYELQQARKRQGG